MEISKLISEFERLIRQYKEENTDVTNVTMGDEVLYKGHKYKVIGGHNKLIILEDPGAEEFSLNLNESEVYYWENTFLPRRVTKYIHVQPS